MASPAELLARLLRQGGILAGTVLLGVLGGAMYGLYKTPAYTADSHVVVVATPPADDATAVKFAQAYGRIATDTAVLSRTNAAARPDGSIERLRSRVRVSTSPDAPLIQLTGTAPTAAQAAEIANQVASSLITFGNARSGQTRVRLSSFADAAAPEHPSSPVLPLDIAVGASAGLLIGGFATTAGIGAARRRRKDPAGALEQAVVNGSRPRPELRPRPLTDPVSSTGYDAGSAR